MITRFLGTVAGALLALFLMEGSGVVITSPLEAVIAALVIGVVWLVIRPIGRVVTLLFDILLLGLPGLFLDAALLMLLSSVLPGIHIASFWWALLGAAIILIARKIGTGIVRNANNPDGLLFYNPPEDEADEEAGESEDAEAADEGSEPDAVPEEDHPEGSEAAAS